MTMMKRVFRGVDCEQLVCCHGRSGVRLDHSANALLFYYSPHDPFCQALFRCAPLLLTLLCPPCLGSISPLQSKPCRGALLVCASTYNPRHR